MLFAIRSHPRLLAIAVALSASLLLFHGNAGTPEGASYMYNLPWFDAFRRAFSQGDLYPRFSPELWYGMGALDFYFYGPLPFWFASIIGEASCPGCSTNTVFSLAGAWMIILSGITFFLFARRFFSVPWAGFGGIFYAILPYHYIADWFDRQAIGEVAACIILPLLALAVTRLIEEQKGGILFAISVAALAYSHLPSTLIFGHLVAICIIWAAIQQDEWSERIAVLARFTVWGLLGIGLSAMYWLPALGLLNTVSPDMLATDYSNPTRWLLLDGYPEIRPEVSAFIKACLTVIVVASLIAMVILKRSIAPPSLWLWIVGPSLFTFYLMTVFSAPIWEYWILNRVQFPWRTLIVG